MTLGGAGRAPPRPRALRGLNTRGWWYFFFAPVVCVFFVSPAAPPPCAVGRGLEAGKKGGVLVLAPFPRVPRPCARVAVAAVSPGRRACPARRGAHAAVGAALVPNGGGGGGVARGSRTGRRLVGLATPSYASALASTGTPSPCRFMLCCRRAPRAARARGFARATGGGGGGGLPWAHVPVPPGTQEGPVARRLPFPTRCLGGWAGMAARMRAGTSRGAAAAAATVPALIALPWQPRLPLPPRGWPLLSWPPRWLPSTRGTRSPSAAARDGGARRVARHGAGPTPSSRRPLRLAARPPERAPHCFIDVCPPAGVDGGRGHPRRGADRPPPPPPPPTLCALAGTRGRRAHQ